MLSAVRRIPVLRLVAAAELAIVARRHVQRLTPKERRRLLELIGRPHRLTASERRDLKRLVDKLAPRVFAGTVAEKLSPVPLPKRLTRPKTPTATGASGG
jgi:hypothetical protein